MSFVEGSFAGVRKQDDIKQDDEFSLKLDEYQNIREARVTGDFESEAIIINNT